METLTLKPISQVDGIVDVPGSKSISSRVLLLSAFASGTTILSNLLDSDDTRYMLNTLKILGIHYQLCNNRTKCKIQGIGRALFIDKPLKLFLGNSGIAMRSLTAALSLRNNDIIVTGEQRMKERPIGHLVDALCNCGAKIDYLNKKNYPPLRIRGGFHGGNIILNGSVSSQFLTSLLMVAPLASCNTKITIKEQLVSRPYIDITLNLMKNFGISIENQSYHNFIIFGNQQYQSPGNYFVESDASSASYFLAAAAIKGGTVKVNGINQNSIQGDIRFADVLEKMGATIIRGNNFIACTRNHLNAIDMDMNHIPDAAMTVAITALFAKGTTTLRNIYNWRIKETDRLFSMSTELRKVGAIVKVGKDFIRITPPSILKFAKIYTIDTYDDHRMAMCCSLLALTSASITLINPKCTAKTFPNYFEQLKRISK